jgi:hypothetical protein
LSLNLQLIQYCKHKGIRTINVVRRQEQIEELKALGCANVSYSRNFQYSCVLLLSCGEGVQGAAALLGCAAQWPAGVSAYDELKLLRCNHAVVPNKGSMMLRRADEVINSQTEDVVARVKEITGGQGAYSALDPVAGYTTSDVSW